MWSYSLDLLKAFRLITKYPAFLKEAEIVDASCFIELNVRIVCEMLNLGIIVAKK